MNLEKKLCKQIPTPEEVKEERLKSTAEFQQRAEKEFQKRGKSKNIRITQLKQKNKAPHLRQQVKSFGRCVYICALLIIAHLPDFCNLFYKKTEVLFYDL